MEKQDKKKKVGAIRISGLSGLIILFILTVISCDNSAKQNYDDLTKIKVGMSIDEVRTIMRNQPIDEKEVYYNKIKNGEIDGNGKDTLYMMVYESVFGSSDDYRILISPKDSTVKKVYLGH